MGQMDRKLVTLVFTLVVSLWAGCAVGAAAQQQDEVVVRAIPAAVGYSPEFDRALQRGWRSETGAPGHSYWQNSTGYDIEARLDPETAKLEGTVQILYAHDAPANLNSVLIHLHQNLHREGSPRSSEQEITGGVTITRLAADGEELSERPLEEGPGWEVDGTLMQVRPTIRLEPGDTLQLDIDWEMVLPQRGAGRMGHSNNEVYLVAYWFPKMGVFDDLSGWAAQPYLGNAEFYDDFGNYKVSISVPTGWTVMATGELQNPEEVFSAITLDQLEAAAVSDTLVVIADAASRGAGTVTAEGTDGWLNYHFSAEKVRDFVWTTSNVQRWDATSAEVANQIWPDADTDSDDTESDDRESDGAEDQALPIIEPVVDGTRRVLIHSFWREDVAPLWAEQWRHGQQAIEFHSEYTAYSYPWSHMTSVEGRDIIEGGMEFPMMTVMGAYEGQEASDLYNVTAHEIGHMWIPMIVGTDEKRHAWMDEGATTFLEGQSKMEHWPGVDHHRVGARSYLQVSAARQEQALMRHGDYYEPGPGYGVASYLKPAALMVALRDVMGEEDWLTAYRAFIAEWSFKKPSPWDFFNTFERFAEDDLDWFWTSFYYETWVMDHAVGRVVSKPTGGATVTIEDRGDAIFPARVRIRTSNGMDFVHEIPVYHWLAGNDHYEIEVAPAAGSVMRVELDPGGYAPDVDRQNNFWPRGSGE